MLNAIKNLVLHPVGSKDLDILLKENQDLKHAVGELRQELAQVRSKVDYLDAVALVAVPDPPAPPPEPAPSPWGLCTHADARATQTTPLLRTRKDRVPA